MAHSIQFKSGIRKKTVLAFEISTADTFGVINLEFKDKKLKSETEKTTEILSFMFYVGNEHV